MSSTRRPIWSTDPEAFNKELLGRFNAWRDEFGQKHPAWMEALETAFQFYRKADPDDPAKTFFRFGLKPDTLEVPDRLDRLYLSGIAIFLSLDAHIRDRLNLPISQEKVLEFTARLILGHAYQVAIRENFSVDPFDVVIYCHVKSEGMFELSIGRIESQEPQPDGKRAINFEAFPAPGLQDTQPKALN